MRPTARPRRLSSARARLTLWNTITFALVLILLGGAFRLLAEQSLLTALDREMRVQAGRYRDAQMIKIVLVHGDDSPSMAALRTQRRIEGELVMAESHITHQYRITRKLGAPAPDDSGQFLYRSFDLQGSPLSTANRPLPSGVHISSGEMMGGDLRMESTADPTEPASRPDYQPWDRKAFHIAASGRECYSVVQSGAGPLRLLSVPMRRDGEISGVAQIAAPLGQLHRDIAGLTRSLLLLLPLGLLVAAVTGLFLTDRALLPVKQMTRSAADIHADELSRRLPVTGADEFDGLASAFNLALDRVETAFKDRERAIMQLRRFTADASHELRTPLAAIKVNTGVALEETAPSEEHIHALRQIDRAANRMTRLVQDLLLLARSDSGQLALNVATVPIASVIQEAVDGLPPLPRAPIAVTAPDPEITLCGDFEQLQRLVLNLLQNAVRHTPPHGRIEIRIERTESAVRIIVEDSGCGIPPEHIPHIGQPFYRVDSGRDRRHGGAGLGLAICRSIAAAHGGSLTIDSAPGRGTRVAVELVGGPAPSAAGKR